jgi:hypothetical protein
MRPGSDYPRPNQHGWTAAEDAVLGTAKDEEVARRLNRPVCGVRARRKQLGIKSPAFNSNDSSGDPQR